MTRIEQLQKKIVELKQKKHDIEVLASRQDTFQMAYKLYLNSVYGFTGTQYSPVFSTDLAQAVTSTGRATIQEMVKFTNNALTKIDAGGTGLTEYVVAGDTDSVFSNTKINGTLQTISEIFEDYKKSGHIEKLRNDVEVAIPNEKNKKTCYSLNGVTKIKNVSKHLVNKDKWKISIDGKELFITNDHSIMIYRNGEVIECKPEDIKSTDYILKRKMI